MTDINLFLQNNPNLAPRDEVRIERLDASPYPDGRRVKVEIDVTPFREQPNLELTIRDTSGALVAASSIISTMHFKMEFNLHLRGIPHGSATGDYTVRAILYYDDLQAPQDTREIPLHIA